MYMNYQEKYLKYKNKYLQLKNQIGGYTFKLDEWKKIENSGQRNCGIFLSDLYPNFILKCDTDWTLTGLKDSIEINNSIQLFPKVIDSTIIGKEVYITMQKFDGDIANMYLNIFPTIVLDKMIEDGLIDKEEKELLFELFIGKTSDNSLKSYDLTIENQLQLDCLHDPEIFELYIKYLQDNPQIISKKTDITIKGILYNNVFSYRIEKTKENYQKNMNILEKFKKFKYPIFKQLRSSYYFYINKLNEMWGNYHEMITRQILQIRLVLNRMGYDYQDIKLDNFGYILSTKPIDDFRKDKVPKIFDKYLYIYFLDWASGLIKLPKDHPDIKDIISRLNERIIELVNNGGDYYIVPFYTISKIIKKNPLKISSGLNIDKLEIRPTLLEILENSYSSSNFDLSRFKHSFKTIDEVEHYLITSKLKN